MITNKLRLFFILICMVFLTSCGFHLRSEEPLPPNLQPLFVTAKDINDPFVIALKRQLARGKIQVVDQQNAAKYILHLNDIQKISLLVASSTTGQVNNYSLRFTVNFSLTDAKGNLLLDNQTVQGSQAYTLSSNTVVSNTAQEQTLLRSIYQEVIYQITMRLNARQVKAALANNQSIAAS
jgi:LPS-assembly lipoprotein